MANISPVLQQRVRQLLGLTGGLDIEPIEAIQPVVVVADYGEGRQPQNESGDTLVRKWYGQHGRTSLAGNYAIVAIRSLQAVEALTWIQRVWITNQHGGALRFAIGRMSNQTALTYGSAGYSDWRLPNNDLGATAFELISAHNPVFPTMYSRIDVCVPDATTVSVPVDFVLVGDGTVAGSIFGVTSHVHGANLSSVSFEGISFTRIPPR